MNAALSLSATGLRKTYPKSGFTLDVDRVEAAAGSTLALLGPSGSGKSTLLHLLGLLEKPDYGEVRLGGRAVVAGDREARLSMAAVFQRPYLFKGTVEGNVGYGLAMRGVPKAERPDRVASALERVGLGGYETRGAQQLSGGEAQRVSLARALVLEPKVLLLDEPLASLDALLKRRLAEEFGRIVRDTDATVVWVTHDQDEALMVADHVAIVNDGRVATSGEADSVMGLPADEWTAAFLGVQEPQTGRVVAAGDGLVELACGSAHVVVVGDARVGSDVQFAVRPEDVLLFEAGAHLPPTTARNQVEATVVSLTGRGAANHAVLDAEGMTLAASVSRAATSDMHLEPGRRVLAVFKATAVRWRSFGADGDHPVQGKASQ
jgi:tungstate transport system ATP-binding protein